MADEADIANAYITNAIKAALDQRQQNNLEPKESAKFCKQCGEEIPEARRQLGNIQLCVPCAEKAEWRDSLFANY